MANVLDQCTNESISKRLLFLKLLDKIIGHYVSFHDTASNDTVLILHDSFDRYMTLYQTHGKCFQVLLSSTSQKTVELSCLTGGG